MSGNVWELTQDLYHPTFYKSDTMYNPVNNPDGNHPVNMRVIRGGSWADENEMDSYLRCSARGPNYPIPESWAARTGFRLVSTTKPNESKTRRASLDYLITKLKESNPAFYAKIPEDSLRIIVLNQNNMTDFTYSSNIKSMGKAIVFSAILPGAGELYSGRLISSLFFFAAEVTGWYSYASNKSKADEIDIEFRQFADAHFSRETYDNWLETYRTEHFGAYPPSYAYVDLPSDIRVRNEDYYARIARYDQFLAGWDDYQPFIGEYGISDNKEHFEGTRQFRKKQYDDFSRTASKFAMFIAANHLFSVVDTIFGIKRRSAYHSEGISWDMNQHHFNGRPAHSFNLRYRW